MRTQRGCRWGVAQQGEYPRNVAYGDSLSDAPLFRHLAATVAVNGDEQITGLAAVHYSGASLVDAYTLARASLAEAG